MLGSLVIISPTFLQSIWSLMSICAVLSLHQPFLQRMSYHGKAIRMDIPGSAQRLPCFLNWRIRKDNFKWFYVLGWLWNASIGIAYYQLGGRSALLSFSLLQLHLSRRAGESFWITYFGTSEMHVGVLFLGVAHYLLLSLSMAQDPVLGTSNVPPTVVTQILVLVFFVYVSLHQFRCNVILARLKRIHFPQYVVPSGDWFDWLLCPLYTCEIGIYLALVGTTGALHPTLLYVFIWVLTNQSVSAYNAQRWYKDRHPSHQPKWVLIPYLW